MTIFFKFQGRFGVVIFENYTKYLNMDKWNKELLDKYLREYAVGLVGFMPSREESLVGAALPLSAPATIDSNVRVKDGYLAPSSPLLRLTRPGSILHGPLPSDDPRGLWTTFSPNHTTYESILLATRAPEEGDQDDDDTLDYFNSHHNHAQHQQESQRYAF
jgi:heparan sulfate N-deacetylase/N-sulfotransferase NDST2